MKSFVKPARTLQYGLAALLAFGGGAIFSPSIVHAQSLTMDLTINSDINSPTYTANIAPSSTYTVDVWVVLQTGASSPTPLNPLNLGFVNTYFGIRAGTTSTEAIAGGTAGNSGGNAGVGVTSYAATSGFKQASAITPGDWNNSGVNGLSSLSASSHIGTLNIGTTSTQNVFGGGVADENASPNPSGNFGSAPFGEAFGTNGWAWEIGTITVKTGATIGGVGSNTTFTSAISPITSSGNDDWTFTGGSVQANPSGTAGPVPGSSPATTGSQASNQTGFPLIVGSTVTFTAPSTSPNPGITLASPQSRQIIGAGGAITLTGNVTNSGTGAYNYTRIVDNGSTGGLLTSLSPQSDTVASGGGSQAYTGTGTVNSGTTPGATVTYTDEVSDGTNTATNSTTVTAVVSRTNATANTGFSIGTANLGSGIYLNGPGAFGAPAFGGTSVINGGTLLNNAATNLTVGSGSSGTLTASQTAGVASGQFFGASSGQTGTWTIGGTPTMTGTSLIAANNVVSGSISMTTTGQGLAGEVTTVNIPYSYTTVGAASIDGTGSGTFTNATAATAVISGSNGSYAGLAVQAIGSSTGGAGVEHSVAQILLGTNSGTYTTTESNPSGNASVGILMRNRMLIEAPGNDSVNAGFPSGTPTSPPLYAGLPLISDVARLYGMSSAAAANPGSNLPGAAVQTDPFAFEMSFNPGTLNAEGAYGNAMASAGNLYLASIIGTTWQNTILANFSVGDSTGTYGGQTINVGSQASAAMGGNFNLPLLESFATFESNDNVTAGDLANFVGAWGVDTTNNEAWAVVNHNSDFAVVPEPSTIVLAAFGLLGCAVALRRKNQATGLRLQA